MLGELVVGGKLAALATQASMLCSMNETGVCITVTRMKSTTTCTHFFGLPNLEIPPNGVKVAALTYHGRAHSRWLR